MKKNSNRSY